eukprot:m.565058 g.565058  ORF g.565058 m.565058 type:complete len:497 (+) comp22239_c3_seq14:391-1881(+)
MENPAHRMRDIEDIGEESVDRLNKDNVVPTHMSKRTSQRRQNRVGSEPPAGDSYIPGGEKIFVRTWGCGHNNSDGEYMAGMLAQYGYTITNDDTTADMWVLNSCAVKNPSEEGFNNSVKRGLGLGKKIVVAGCVPQGQPRGRYVSNLSIIGVQQIDRVVEVVEETFKGNVVQLLGERKTGKKRDGGAPLNLPKIRRNPLVEVVPISTGCLNQCTYCKTKHARGNLGSYPKESIVDRVRSVIAEGVVEIWLTSEDTGAYGRDIGTNLPELLEEILAVMPEGTMLRLGMTNPPYIMEHIDRISTLLKHPRMYTYLHVPVQAASDEILYRMKREYTQEDFRRVVDGVRATNPTVTIATDIIAGFPGETEADFEETMELCREYEFPCLYINQFFARPGTPAASMEKCDTKMVKERTKRLSALFRSYFPHARKVGMTPAWLVVVPQTPSADACDGLHKPYRLSADISTRMVANIPSVACSTVSRSPAIPEKLRKEQWCPPV